MCISIASKTLDSLKSQCFNVQSPASNAQSPQSSFQHPQSIVQNPASRVQHPASGVQRPASGVQRPAFRVQSRASRVQRPGSRIQSLASRVQPPESSVQLLRIESRNSGMAHKTLHIPYISLYGQFFYSRPLHLFSLSTFSSVYLLILCQIIQKFSESSAYLHGHCINP